MLIWTFNIDVHHVHISPPKWYHLKGYSKLLICYKLMILRLHQFVSLAALIEDIHGHCRLHIYFLENGLIS